MFEVYNISTGTWESHGKYSYNPLIGYNNKLYSNNDIVYDIALNSFKRTVALPYSINSNYGFIYNNYIYNIGYTWGDNAEAMLSVSIYDPTI